MIALIPGLTASLAALRSPGTATSDPQEGFSQILQSASQNTSKSPSPEPSSPVPDRYVVQKGDNLSAIAKKLGYADPMALARANHLKDPDRLQIGQVLSLPEQNGPTPPSSGRTRLAQPEVKAAVEQSQTASAVKSSHERHLVVASWYGSQHHGKLMANGEPFNMFADTAAHKKLPLGTHLTVTNPKNGATVEVEVTDRGPYIPGRNLDLSFGAARKLGIVKTGVAKVWMEDG